MKGTCNDCVATMDPPAITVVIHDLEKGTAIGYYCKHECAITDANQTLNHLKDNTTISGSPGAFAREPVLVVNPAEFEAGTVIDVGVEITTAQPPYKVKGYSLAKRCAERIVATLSDTVHGKWEFKGESWMIETTEKTHDLDSGHKLPYLSTTYTLTDTELEVEVGHDDTLAWVKFPDAAWNLEVSPDGFEIGTHGPWIVQHIEVLAANAKVKAPAPPTVEPTLTPAAAE